MIDEALRYKFPFDKMTLTQLRQERNYWENKVETAMSWGAALGAAHTFLQACEKWIEYREKEVNDGARDHPRSSGVRKDNTPVVYR